MQQFHPCPPVGISLPKKAVVVVLGLASGLLRFLRRARSRPAPGQKVILLEPFGMGDAISLLPLVQLLHDHGFGVVVCARPAWRPFFPGHVEWIDSAVPWASYGDGEKYKINALLGKTFRGFLRRLRDSASGHIGLDTRGDSRSTLLLWLAGCSPVYSLNRYLGSDLFNLRMAARHLVLDQQLRRWQVNAQFAALLGCSLDRLERPRIHPPAATPREKKGIGIVPITPWPGRAWPASHWQELIRSLRADGESVTVLGGPGQDQALRAAAGPEAEIVMCTSIGDWIDRLSGFEAVIALDSGPAHLADALSVPLVALYGSGQLPLWAPSGPCCVALHRQNDADYQPIHPVDANIARGLELMARHTVPEVLRALAEVRRRASVLP
jgi:ADP-heptose:LPS heptosyltransferase